MNSEIPRIEAVSVIGPTHLRVIWRGAAHADEMDLLHWIASGGEVLAPLLDQAVFARAATSNHGAAVTWDDSKGDLSIDAANLALLIRNVGS